MSRVHISTEDLARLRVAGRLGPEIEGVLALDVLARVRAAEYGAWRSQVRVGLGDILPEVRELADRLPTLADKLRNFVHDSSTRPNGVAADARDTEIMTAFRAVAILPYWGQIREHLETVSDTCGRIGMTVGIERLLGVLHSTVRWAAPVLTIRDGIDRDVELGGRGLVLTPSYFLAGNNTLLLDGETPTLVFAVPVDPDLAGRRDGTGSAEQWSLSALLGHTRATALRELTTSHTTGELSAGLGISLAGVSKHTAVLRRAGLITTSRIRNTAVHSVTSLGMALLNKKSRSANCETCAVDYPRLPVLRAPEPGPTKVNLA